MGNAALRNGFKLNGVRNVKDVKDIQELETADFRQVDQWAGIYDNRLQFSGAHARSSIIAACWRSASST
jgi:hypothetical protein